MFENLSQKLDLALRTLKGSGSITELNIAETVKEIRRALIEADVNYKVAKEITDRIREEAIGQKVMISVQPGQLFTKIVYDELVKILGGTTAEFVLKGQPAVVLIAGLQGSGKTTFTAKLGNMLKKQGRQVLLAACDIYRPAAIDQLRTLGAQIGIEVYAEPTNRNAVEIAQKAIETAQKTHKQVVIIDTAGRLAIDEEMMQEIEAIKKAVNPTETLFVVDAMTGQDAVNTAKIFNERLDFDGIVLTKLDGDTRGGAALSIKTIVNKPIKFISTGEKPDTIDTFHPDRMAQRILGFGDVISLVEKAQQAFDEEEARRLNKKIRKNQFDYNDLLAQIKQIKKMGDFKDILSLIPGMSKQLQGAQVDEKAFVRIEAIINSMTPKERANPDILDQKRKLRIAKGSGTTIQQVNALIKQFEEMRRVMKMMNHASSNTIGGKLKKIFKR